jgi:hypothetical protein
VDDWLDALGEHDRIVAALDEERSEQASLLLLYRDFLAAGQFGLHMLLNFLSGYSLHVMSMRARSKPTRTFGAENLRRLISEMELTYREILEDEGFEAVADAMRRATVTEQFWKSKGKQQYEIQYGLFPEIRRKKDIKPQFVSAIGDFVARYNAETARYQERKAEAGDSAGRRRPRVTTSQLDSFVRLVDRWPADVVAMLLLAFASSRVQRGVGDAISEDLQTDDPAHGEPDIDESEETE